MIFARKRFGQHFLHDRSVLDRIVREIAPKPEQALLEIGPGRGALTERLIGQCRTLDAIEIDRDLAAQLRARWGAPQAFELHESDALDFDLAALARMRGARLRVIGNLPYNISTPLLFHIAAAHEHIDDLHVMLQKEVVERMTALPGTPEYGRLTVMLQAVFRITRLFTVPAGAFRPVPKVDSSVVRLVPLREAKATISDVALFGRVVAAAFGQRRKTMRNALSTICDEAGLERAGIDPGVRGETLSVAEFVRLANDLAERAA